MIFSVSLFPNFGRLSFFYITSLILCFVFISVDCFSLKELFEELAHIELYQIETLMPVFLEPEDRDSLHTRDPIV